MQTVTNTKPNLIQELAFMAAQNGSYTNDTMDSRPLHGLWESSYTGNINKALHF